jgi:hypothetical protein
VRVHEGEGVSAKVSMSMSMWGGKGDGTPIYTPLHPSTLHQM